MPDVARKRDRWSDPDDIPEWFHELKGFDRLSITPDPKGEGHGFSAQYPGHAQRR